MTCKDSAGFEVKKAEVAHFYGTCTAKAAGATTGAASSGDDDDYVRVAAGGACNAETEKTGCVEGNKCGITYTFNVAGDKDKDKATKSAETCINEETCGNVSAGETYEVVC